MVPLLQPCSRELGRASRFGLAGLTASSRRILLLSVGLVAVGWGATGCGSAPTSPAQSNSSTLVIAGATSLTPGRTSQLTALTSLGAVVTSGVTWQSKASAVATVSATGLLTANGLGTTTITASTSTASGSATVVVASGNTVTTISACTLVTAPGQYVLNADVLGEGLGGCLRFSSLGGAQLDCGGHVVAPISLDNINTMTIRNCAIHGNLAMSNVNTITVTNCQLTGGLVQVSAGTNVELLSDTITINQTVIGEAISLQGGTNNQVRQTTVTGGYDGSLSRTGTDDGIVLTNETGDDIEGNTISGFYDAGVEGIGVVANTTVANNTLTNLGLTGVGAYWCTNWTGNVIRGNSVSMAAELAYVFYNTGTLCGTTTAPPAFSGNHIVGNIFRNPMQGAIGPPNASPRMFVSMTGTVGGNLVQNNDFGPNDGPELVPLSGFIDGGGNICGPLNPVLSNFACTGGGFRVRFSSGSPGPEITRFLVPPLGAARVPSEKFGERR